jgi:hypothetical protein
MRSLKKIQLRMSVQNGIVYTRADTRPAAPVWRAHIRSPIMPVVWSRPRSMVSRG